MGDKIQDNNQELEEVLDTLSLTDFPTTQEDQHHRNPPSHTEEFFEFFRGDFDDFSQGKMMSNAEDIIFCGKLVPINEQHHHRKKPPQQKENHHHHRRQPYQPILCRRSESMSEVKTPPATGFVRTSRSLDYKKLHRNSSMSSEPAPEIKKSSSSSRWYVFLFGLVKVPPPEMDLRDMKNRRVRRTTSKTVVSESGDVVPVNRSDDDQQKCSWRVLGFLSCKSSASAAVTTPLRYMPKV
ncbi:hypothetical protein L6452_26949 [Arctium lappa]|uniref:Uncharacterized protein n=1 Tax=Arctium lappa TaxID=4217 RepID=A0ACB8ZVH9_ARCLA|nr:hypothetical protein L6452_26949 [Arctium lappa]